MIRVNLLPKAKQRFAFGGLSLDSRYVRPIAVALAVVALVALVGSGIEALRARTLDGAAQTLEARIAAESGLRTRAKSLALDVARFQEFQREESAYRRSGSDVAIAIARIGNVVPRSAWLDSIRRGDDGAFDIAGGSRSAETVAGVVSHLQSVLPDHEASLVRLEDHGGDGVRFDARVSPPATPAPGAAPAGAPR